MSTWQGWSCLPQNPFPFVALGWGQPQRDLQEIWRAEVQQQPVLRLNPCEITGNAEATPPAGSPFFLGPPSQTCATQTPLDFLLQLPRALGQVCVQRHDEAGQFCRSPVSFAGGLEEAGDHPGSSHQATLPMDFSRQEYRSGLPFPSLGDLPQDPGIQHGSPALKANSFTL